MKRGLVYILILCMLLGVVLTLGCTVAHGNGSDVCREFIEYIACGSYGASHADIGVRPAFAISSDL